MVEIKQTVAIEPFGEDGVFAVKPHGYINDFSKYRDALRGLKYEPIRRVNYAKFESLPQTVARLQANGFNVVAEPEILAALTGQADALDADAVAADGIAQQAAAEIESRGLTLYPFQAEGARWLRERSMHKKNALLADQMGLGKTIQALAALPENAAAIVVCPASVKLNWRHEIRKWRADLDPRIVKGKRAFFTPKAGQVVILNDDLLPECPDELTFEPGTVFIADEAHRYKNRAASRSKKVRELRTTLDERGGRTWFLTGTPLLNYPMELWSLLDCLGVAVEAFSSRNNFRQLYQATHNQWGATDYGRVEDGDRSVIAQALRRVSLMRLRSEVMPELPAKMRTDVPVEIDAETTAMLDEAVAKLKALGIDLFGATSVAEAFRGRRGDGKENGVAFEVISKVRAALATAKIPTVLDLVEQYEDAGEPLVYFSCFLAPVEAVAARPGWAKITGEVSNEKRQEIVEKFQAGKLKGVALTIAAGGVGLTLTRAANVLQSDLDWTPGLNSQAEDRVCRIGQTRPVQITRLVADHKLDRRILELLTVKDEHIATVEQSAVRSVTASGSGAKRAAASALRAMVGELAVLTPPPPAPTTAETLAAEHVPGARKVVTVTTADGRTLRVSVRPPLTDAERHAGPALVTLAGLSPDGCAIKNDMGFSATDLEFGMSLAKTFQEAGGLSDRQWIYAVKIVAKYHRQIGRPTATTVGA